MKNRETLSKWVYDLHEEINTMLGKKSNLTYEDVKLRYEMFRSRCLEAPKGKKTKKTSTSVQGKHTKKTKSKKESGCVKPLYGIKSKCVIHIVPKETNPDSFVVDPQCHIKRD